MRWKVFSMVVLIIGWSVALNGQQLPIIQRFEDGIFESSNDPVVKTMCQDRQGMMYFGKRTGLYKWNSTTWEKIIQNNKEEVTEVEALQEDTEGILWVGAREGLKYLVHHPNGVDTCYELPLRSFLPAKDSLIKFASPRKIVFINHTAFIHYNNDYVLEIKYEVQQNKPVVKQARWLPLLKFQHLFRLGKKLYLYHQQKGYFEWNGEKLEPLKLQIPSQASQNLQTVIPINDFQVILGFQGTTFYRFDGNQFYELAFEEKAIMEQGIVGGVRYQDRYVVVATYYDGAVVYDFFTGKVIKKINAKNGYFEGDIFSLWVDKENGIWIGGRMGLVRVVFSDYIQDFQNLNEIRENVNDVYAFGKNMLFATHNGLIRAELDDKGIIQKIYKLPELKNAVCYQLKTMENEESEELEHSILIATNIGTYEYLIEKNQLIKVYHEGIHKILPLQYDYVLLVSSFYIYLLEKVEGKWKQPIRLFESKHLIHSVVSCCEDSLLWIGTDHGVHLLSFDDIEHKVTHKGNALKKYGKNEVRFIFKTPYAINYRGAFPLKQNTFQKDVALSQYINDRTPFTEWQNKLIVYHKNEYLVIEKKNDSLFVDTLYALSNLATHPFQILADNDRNIFCFTKDRIICFNANIYNQLRRKTPLDSLSRTHIYKVWVDEVLIPFHESIHLNKKVQSVEVHFGTPKYNNQGPFLYQYMLEGLNDTWSDWKRGDKLVLNGLSYGSYTLKIRIKDELGRVYPEASFSLYIAPPFYATPTAIGLYVVLGILLIYAIVRLYSANLERIIKERTKELEKQKKIAIEQKQLAEERNELLEKANEELKTSVETIQNQQEQLVRQEKMATLGQLVANTAHELNTPIGAILNSIRNIETTLPTTFENLPTLLTQLSTQEQNTFFHLITRVALNKTQLSTKEERHLRMKLEDLFTEHQIPFADEIAEKFISIGLVEDLDELISLLKQKKTIIQQIVDTVYHFGKLGANLNIIHIAADKTKKKVHGLKVYTHSQPDEPLTDISLIDSIETVLTVYGHYFKNDVELVRDYQVEPTVKGYADNLMQVWTNLIFNAIQAMGGKGRLRLSIQEQNGLIAVHVEDNGPGIPPEIQSQIFQPLFTTKPKGEGSGLGLSIVQKIVEKHQGKIDFTSKPGQTIFTVYLPKKS